MALKFGAATSDRVPCGTGSSMANLATYTMLMLVYPTGTSITKLYSKGEGSHTSHALRFDGTGAAGGAMAFFRGYSTTDVDYEWSSTQLITANRWYWVALTFDGSVTPPVRLYTAPLGGFLVEETTLAFSQNPSGTRFDDSANAFTIGNRFNAPLNQAFQGNIASLMWVNSVLPFALLEKLIVRPSLMPGTVGFWRPGAHGQLTVLDLSGNANHGSVTGATLAVDPPLHLGQF